jgi:hypothetical protein
MMFANLTKLQRLVTALLPEKTKSATIFTGDEKSDDSCHQQVNSVDQELTIEHIYALRQILMRALSLDKFSLTGNDDPLRQKKAGHPALNRSILKKTPPLHVVTVKRILNWGRDPPSNVYSLGKTLF